MSGREAASAAAAARKSFACSRSPAATRRNGIAGALRAQLLSNRQASRRHRPVELNEAFACRCSTAATASHPDERSTSRRGDRARPPLRHERRAAHRARGSSKAAPQGKFVVSRCALAAWAPPPVRSGLRATQRLQLERRHGLLKPRSVSGPTGSVAATVTRARSARRDDLAGARLAAEPRREVRTCRSRRTPALLKTITPSVASPCAMPMPRRPHAQLRQGAKSGEKACCSASPCAPRARGALHWKRVVEDDHHAVARKMLERAAETPRCHASVAW